jgi:hypothetical protein
MAEKLSAKIGWRCIGENENNILRKAKANINNESGVAGNSNSCVSAVS